MLFKNLRLVISFKTLLPKVCAYMSLALHSLEQEHQQGLVLIEQWRKQLQSAEPKAITDLIRQVVTYNEQELEQHLQHEEQTLFMPLMQEHPQYKHLCIQLGQEHGELRHLAETLLVKPTPALLVNFLDLLERHTLVENEQLMPVIDQLLTAEQLQAVRAFTPLPAGIPIHIQSQQPLKPSTEPRTAWLAKVDAFFQQMPKNKAAFVLLPRFEPRWSIELARHLELDFFNFQREVMAQYQERADQLALEDMSMAIRELAEARGFVFFHTEALLCVKSAAERKQWFEQVLQLTIDHPMLIPLSLYQEEVPENYPAQICDLELEKLPRYNA